MAPKFEKRWVPDATNPAWILRGFSNYRLPIPMRRPVEVLPNIFSFDPTFLAFQKALVENLNANPALAPTLDENSMVGDNGIHTNFNRLMTVAGYSSSPMSWIPRDNSSVCDDLGIPRDFRNERHRKIFDEFFDLVFASWKPTALKVPKFSVLGIPMMSQYDASYKRECSVFLYTNIDRILLLVGQRNFKALAEEYGIVFCYNTNRRGQVDEPGKVRMSNTKEFALSSGRRGTQVPADKHVIIDGVRYDGYSATRERVVQGASWMINSILQVVASGHMHAMFDRWPTVFHHRDPNDIARAAASEGDATFSDVSTYDASMREFLIRRLHDRARNQWPAELIDMSEILYFSPYYSRPMEIAEGKQRGQFVGDPMNPITNGVSAGNRSGHAWTSFVAKTIKVFDSLCVIDDIYQDVVGRVDAYLKDQSAIKLRNNGDDEGALGSKVAIAAYRKVRYDGQHGYFSVAPEAGQGFSGSLMIWSGAGRAVSRAHTSLEKWICPERSIGGLFRKNWVVGMMARLENLEKHPSGGEILEGQRKAWHDVMQPKWGGFGEILIAAMEGLDICYDGLTAIDKEVLDDPEKLYYKYTDADVSPDVLDKVVMRIQPEEFPWALSMYKGFVI